MGRPLKIAKAQAVVTITNTTTTTNVITTSANFTNLGIIAGMPFIPATSIGGLTGGTVYWILQVINSGNNSTFTASATHPSANPTFTTVPLSTASGTVSTTVSPVDNYFNNPVSGAGYPATNTATYGVVGGNTAIYGKEVLCNVALGVNGTGTLYTSNTSATIVGLGTDLANVANGTILFNGANLIGTVANNVGSLTVAIANTTATGNVIGTSGNAQTLVANAPVTFSASFGNLTAGSTYFVKTIANASAFTVSLTPGGANVGLTSNASVTANAIQQQSVLAANALVNLTGGSFVQALPEAGYIVRQKGKQKYLVKGTTTGLVGQCYTANVANTALTPNTMTITATYANSATVKIQSLSDYSAEAFTATSGPVATGNIVLQNATPLYASFNSAATANAANGQPFPIVTIGNA